MKTIHLNDKISTATLILYCQVCKLWFHKGFTICINFQFTFKGIDLLCITIMLCVHVPKRLMHTRGQLCTLHVDSSIEHVITHIKIW